MNKDSRNFKRYLLLVPAFIFYSCAPKINFTASPATITKGDSVLLNWKIKGKPALMFDQRKIAHPPNDSLEIIEFTLSVQRGKKVKTIKRQIAVLPKESTDRVVLITNDLKEDTLIADGMKDAALFAGFEVISVSSVTDRPVTVVHAGITSELKNPENPSDVWKGTPYAGYWKITTLLTPAEKQDHSTIPGQLEIRVLIRPLKK